MKLYVQETNQFNLDRKELDKAVKKYDSGEVEGFEIVYRGDKFEEITIFCLGSNHNYHISFVSEGAEMHRTSTTDLNTAVSRINKWCRDNNIDAKFDRVKYF